MLTAHALSLPAVNVMLLRDVYFHAGNVFEGFLAYLARKPVFIGGDVYDLTDARFLGDVDVFLLVVSWWTIFNRWKHRLHIDIDGRYCGMDQLGGFGSCCQY